MLSAFLALSEGRDAARAPTSRRCNAAPRRSSTRPASAGWSSTRRGRRPALHDFAMRALALELVAADDDVMLYRPGVGSDCRPAAAVAAR